MSTDGYPLSLITNHKKVASDGFRPDEVTVDSGVPQGTVFDPYFSFFTQMICQLKSLVLRRRMPDIIFQKTLVFKTRPSFWLTYTSLGKWTNTWGMHFNENIIPTGKGNP